MQLPNTNDTSSSSTVPMALGFTNPSNAYIPSTNSWHNYMDMPIQAYSLDCFIHYEDAIYLILEDVLRLDPFTWELTTVVSVPSFLQRPGKCAGLSIGGDPGIITRDGNWLNLNTLQWEVKVMPYYDPAANVPNAMWSFRGLPTIFGVPSCDGADVCENRDVIQYDPQLNKWTTLGSMVHSRSNHEVIEVSASFCNEL